MKQDRICITSAQGINAERALDAFPDVLDTEDNTVDREVVERECGPDAVVGRIEIVRRFRELYLEQTGRDIGAARARQRPRSSGRATTTMGHTALSAGPACLNTSRCSALAQ